MAGDRTRRTRHDLLARHSRDHRERTGLVNSISKQPNNLIVLDMAGTTVADGGLVEQAFTAAAERLGEDPATMIDYVRATMG